MSNEYSDVTRRNARIYREKVHSYGIAEPIHQQISSLIHTYRINYYENSEFLFKYTGMTKKQYARRVESMGIKNVLSLHYKIKNQLIIGFDLIFVAALANVFKLPTTLILNHRITELDNFVPEEYGIYQNMYSEKKKLSYVDYVAAKSDSKSVFKRITKEKALKKSNYPPGVVNILKYIDYGV